MTTKQPSLRAILTAFYADHQANLHDGRSAAHPDIDAYVQKIEALFAPSLFEQVMTASERYVTRFGGELSLEGAVKKMHEEWQEMHDEIKQVAIEEALEHLGAPSRVASAKVLLAKEAIDLLVTIGGVLSALRTPIAMTVDAAHVTLDKLDSRTTEGYAWNGTTVERIGKAVQS